MGQSRSIWSATYTPNNSTLEKCVEENFEPHRISPTNLVWEPASEEELKPYKAHHDMDCLNYFVS